MHYRRILLSRTFSHGATVTRGDTVAHGDTVSYCDMVTHGDTVICGDIAGCRSFLGTPGLCPKICRRLLLPRSSYFTFLSCRSTCRILSSKQQLRSCLSIKQLRYSAMNNNTDSSCERHEPKFWPRIYTRFH